jgi:transposase
LARLQEKPFAYLAKDLRISEQCLRRWMAIADVDDGHKLGIFTDERKELVELRRRNRVPEMEVGILKRVSA